MQNIYILLIIIFSISCQSEHKEKNTPSNVEVRSTQFIEFQKILSRAGLKYKINSTDFNEVKIIPNYQMHYEYALKHKNKNFEVRFAIIPYDFDLSDSSNIKLLELYKKGFYKMEFETILLNISGGQSLSISQFDSIAVFKEFNANWGATAYFGGVDKEFGQKYNYCMTVTIHKTNLGSAFIFYLSDNKENLETLVKPIFHSLRFTK